jgi:Tfp pilus assembly protein PilV
MLIKNNTTGSTLIEVLIAIVLIGFVVTGVMLSLTYSVKNSAEARYREVASQLAQDGMEIVKLRREVDDWSDFYAFSSLAGITYCLDQNVAPNLNDTGTCTNNVNDGNKAFTRSVVMTRVPAAVQTVRATVSVQWVTDSNDTVDVVISQDFLERAI